MVRLSERRRAVAYLTGDYDISERRACSVLSMHRSSFRYSRRCRISSGDHQQVIARSEQYSYWGYRKLHELVRGDGHRIGREQVRLVRRREGLQVPVRVIKRRSPGASTKHIATATHPNHVWSYDFIFDRTEDARTLKCLTVVDEFTRMGLDIPLGRGFSSGQVIRTLADLMERWGPPECLRSDNGSEFIADRVRKWLKDNQIGTHYIDPGSPWQNPYNESFNSIFRITCLNRWLFLNQSEARVTIRDWLNEYNTVRPHGSLQGRTPIQFFKDWRSRNPGRTTMKLPKSLT